ncbi:capsule assembly Wzi family protein [Gracilinema caldarium]|uniref:capsule assembly Wzi family protein n=1 Tax=Gracilinema caldarium TaxID=215591 RepID=UPI0026EE20FB|nr:capsule assembly Wzi family protein [Gracilinema caldarium]
MKKIISLILIGFICLLSLAAQVINDPNDNIYKDIDRWAIQGYITTALPQIRPYPAQILDLILKEVADRGDPVAQKKAVSYIASIAPDSRPVHIGLHGTITGRDSESTLFGAPKADGVFRIEPWITGSYDLQVYGSLKTPGNEIIVPGNYSPYPDFVVDAANVGQFYILQNWNSTLTIGADSFYFQSGLNRTSFGPFYDSSLVVGAQAGRAGHFSLVYRSEWWNYSILFLSISATNDFGNGQFPEKYIMIHAYDFQPLTNFEFGFFETVVWGGRFEPFYFIPFNQLFAAQSIVGFADNSLFGIHFRWRAFPGLQMLGQVYVDDLHFNDMVSFKFDTRYKLSAQAGLNYMPIKSWAPNVRLEYTAVMPYMYTHITGDVADRYVPNKPNYFNYTHRGANLGTDLEPNSDRVKLSISKDLLSAFNLKLTGFFTRHGNASEGIPNMDSNHDGDIFDDGYDSANKVTFDRETRFLTQSVIDYRLAGGFSLSWSLPTSFGSFGLQADYVLEYGWNRNLVKDDNGLTNFWGISASWRW